MLHQWKHVLKIKDTQKEGGGAHKPKRDLIDLKHTSMKRCGNGGDRFYYY